MKNANIYVGMYTGQPGTTKPTTTNICNYCLCKRAILHLYIPYDVVTHQMVCIQNSDVHLIQSPPTLSLSLSVSWPPFLFHFYTKPQMFFIFSDHDDNNDCVCK